MGFWFFFIIGIDVILKEIKYWFIILLEVVFFLFGGGMCVCVLGRGGVIEFGDFFIIGF